MEMKSDEIFFRIQNYIEDNVYLYFIIGGRGIGKTFSFLDMVNDNDIFWMYLRRKDVEYEACLDAEGNPFKKWNKKRSKDWRITKAKKWGRIEAGDEKNPDLKGYAGAFSTFDNLRGIDFTDVNIVMYDEFIPKKSRDRIKNEGFNFLDMYETMCRDRELDGLEPVKVICNSNAVSLNSPILEYLDLVRIAENMVKSGQQVFTDRRRGIKLIMPVMEEFKELKQETFIARLSKNTTYYDFALENKFTEDSFYSIKKQNLQEYTPWIGYEDIYVYKHKSNGTYYVCHSKADCAYYTEKDTRLLFCRRFCLLREKILDGHFTFSDYSAKCTLLEVLGLN